MALLRLFTAIGFLVLSVVAPLRAQELVADLSSSMISITTGFSGTDVVLFGALERGTGDVAVTIEGPVTDAIVRQKERSAAGIWVNTNRLTFKRVPMFYAVAATRPLKELASSDVLKRHGIGLDHVDLGAPKAGDPERVAAFRAALIRTKQRDALYPLELAPVTFVGGPLFRTTIHIPANVPTGAYLVRVYLFRDGEVASVGTTPLVVRKTGLSAGLYKLAYDHPLFYGIMAVLTAIGIGWAASSLFGRTPRES